MIDALNLTLINTHQTPEEDLPTTLSPSDSDIAARLDSLWSHNFSNIPNSIQGLKGLEIGPYRIDEPIGAGAFGVVYKAHHVHNRQIVALKIPHREWLSNPDSLKRFENEARACASLDHESIVPLISADLSGNIPFIASVFIDGPDLAEWLSTSDEPSKNATEIARFAIQIVRAVTYAHRMGVIHQDIKPGNILMLPHSGAGEGSKLNDFSPMLADFGLAKLTLEPIVNSRSSLIIGTPLYMAPEQLLPNWGPTTERTDIYSLGVLLFELIEGKPPRYGKNYSEIMAMMLRERQVSTMPWTRSVAEDLKRIVHKCLEMDPMDRYARAEDLANDLDAFLVGRRIANSRSRVTRSFLRWARNPKCPIEVCYFIIPANLIFFAWMIVNAVLIAGSLYQGNGRINDLIECIGLAFGINIVIPVLCVLRIYGFRWTTWVALVLSFVVNGIVLVLILLGVMPSFEGLYSNAPLFRITNHMMVLFYGIVQSALLGISVYSDSISSRRG